MSGIARALVPTPDSLGQCQALREGKYFNDTPNTNKQCCFTAKYEVAGQRLCAKHAGVAALRILMESK